MVKLSRVVSITLSATGGSLAAPASGEEISMSVFTFYLWKTDSSAESFEMFALDDDAQAAVRARAMLAQHPTCAFVTVWDGDRLTHTENRCEAFDPRPEFQRGAPLGIPAEVCDLCANGGPAASSAA
jgi:hypothetical protein